MIGILISCFGIIAFLYAAVGHGGASGYIGLMILFGFTPDEFKVPALIMNILVATMSGVQFYLKKQFQWKRFWPLALVSIPFAYYGSKFPLKETWIDLSLVVFLWFAAFTLFKPIKQNNNDKVPWPFGVLLLISGVIGWLSGMIGIGGGIILTPFLVWAHWGNAKHVAALSAWFIVVNSVAGLLAVPVVEICNTIHWLSYGLILIVFMGFLGAWWGTKKGNEKQLRQLMGMVLLLASVKLIVNLFK